MRKFLCTFNDHKHDRKARNVHRNNGIKHTIQRISKLFSNLSHVRISNINISI